MMCPEHMKTKEGYDLQFGTNHLGHFLLTNILLPKLQKSAASGHNTRIVIVSSLAHTMTNGIRFDDVNFKTAGSYTPGKAYAQSKLANVMHAAALAKRLENTGVTVYSLHPGVINTELSRHIVEDHPILTKLISPITTYVSKTPFYGAQTTLYCTLEDKLSVQSGKYYSDCDEATPKRCATIEEDQEKLWKLSEAMVEGNK